MIHGMIGSQKAQEFEKIEFRFSLIYFAYNGSVSTTTA